MMRILRDDREQYSIVKEKLQISDDKIDDCIKNITMNLCKNIQK